jgi:hypothetical protein
MAKKGGAPTKSEIVAQITKDTDLSRKQVAAVFESLNGQIKKSLRSGGLFTLPRPAQAEGREEARHEGARRHQSLHEGKDGVQGEAGLEEGPRAAVEEPQGLRQLMTA